MMPSNGTRHRYGSRRVRITASRRACTDSGGEEHHRWSEFVNCDFISPTGDWQLISHVLCVPER